MSPSKKSKRRAQNTTRNGGSGSAAAVHDRVLAFYKTADGEVPARRFLLDCPQPVREMLTAAELSGEPDVACDARGHEGHP